MINFLLQSDFLTIDIGFRYIKIAQVRKRKNDELVIVNFGLGDTPKGCIKNGAIRDKSRVTAEIRKVIKENSLMASSAKIVISGTNIITRIIMVDKGDGSDVEDRIWKEITACLPINVEEHRVDYKILDTISEGSKLKMKVFVTAVSKKIIGSYTGMLSDLNLKPISVDIPANSVSKFFKRNVTCREQENWARAQKYSRLKSSNTIAVVDLGSETTIVNILKNRVPEFNRVALMGSSNIDNAIYKDLNLVNDKEGTAERYKKMYGITDKRDLNNELEWKCSNAAKTVVSEVIRNVRQCFDFYISRCAGENISKIFLIGGGSQMKGIRDYFEENLNTPTYPVDLLDIEGIEFSSNLDTEKMSYLINALGTAL